MKPWQKIAKYTVLAIAIILALNIVILGLKVCGLIIGISSSGTLEEAETQVFDGNIADLDIDVATAELSVYTDDVDKITVTSNLKNLTVRESGGKLIVKEKHSVVSTGVNDAFVEIILPQGALLGEVDLSGGAGVVELKNMSIKDLDIDLGAGEAVFTALEIDRADIDGGAGRLTVNDCKVGSLDLDMGVGELKFTAEITEKADMSIGVGSADILLLGNKENYRFDLDRGIGEIMIDGKAVGNSKVGNGSVLIDIDGGIGSLDIRFE